MEPFVRVTGIVAPLPVDNVDTDAIIPSRETQSVSRSGYGEKLFANWRYLPGTRDPDPGFVLNRRPFNEAQILLSGRNFGCGSSREAAVWSLAQFGIRCIIAESFGSIFRINCIRNGLLPITQPATAIEEIGQLLKQQPILTVDLEKNVILCADGMEFPFQIGSRDREMLLIGADEITMTLNKGSLIEHFREKDRRRRPWMYTAATEAGHAEGNKQTRPQGGQG